MNPIGQIWGSRRSSLLSQPGAYFGCGKSSHPNSFVSAVLAGSYGNGRTRNVQKFRQEAYAGGVGPAIDGGSGQAQLDRVTHCAGDPIPRAARAHLDPKSGAPRNILNLNHRTRC
jgi:hypothetical protein